MAVAGHPKPNLVHRCSTRSPTLPAQPRHKLDSWSPNRTPEERLWAAVGVPETVRPDGSVDVRVPVPMQSHVRQSSRGRAEAVRSAVRPTRSVDAQQLTIATGGPRCRSNRGTRVHGAVTQVHLGNETESTATDPVSLHAPRGASYSKRQFESSPDRCLIWGYSPGL